MSVDFSLVLPCYNEEKNIKILFEEFINLPRENVNKIELVFVNNGSTDKTEQEIDKVIEINKSNKNVIINKVNLVTNQEYGGGIVAGLNAAKGDYLGWAHADLQTPLLDFYKLFKIVIGKNKIFGKGYRVNNRGFDGIVSRFHENLASVILGVKLKEINAQPKIFSRDLMRYFNNFPKKWTVLDTYVFYVCLKNKIEIKVIDVIFKNRLYGQSKWKNNFKNFISHIFFNIVYLFKLRFTKVKNDSE
tara:strand:- start:4168 stop:4905 length:738 start_codon:yes stop_codon:yes gene_type:complete